MHFSNSLSFCRYSCSKPRLVDYYFFFSASSCIRFKMMVVPRFYSVIRSYDTSSSSFVLVSSSFSCEVASSILGYSSCRDAVHFYSSCLFFSTLVLNIFLSRSRSFIRITDPSSSSKDPPIALLSLTRSLISVFTWSITLWISRIYCSVSYRG